MTEKERAIANREWLLKQIESVDTNTIIRLHELKEPIMGKIKLPKNIYKK